MPWIVLILSLSLMIGRIADAKQTKADEIISKSINALGGYERLKALQSLNMSGIYREGSYQGEAHMTKMRSNLRLVGCLPEVCNGKRSDYLEGYDGKRGWEANLKRQRMIRTRRKAELALRCGSEFDPMFVDYKQKGYKTQFIGEDKLFGKTPVWIVRITPPQCQIHDFYFDKENFLPIAQRKLYNIHARGEAVDVLTVFSDFRDLNGVKISFKGEERNAKTGELISSATWETIAANTIQDTSIFQAPVVHPGPGTKLVLDMLAQSETTPAKKLLGLYHDFRKKPENKQIDMTSNLTFLGYELLKADNYDLAIPIMEILVSEYPNSAANYDSLGDAYLQKGEKNKAAAAFRKALQLDPNAKGTKAKLDRLEQ
jgi:tetratricopeptide (TPR) repeat protein